MTEEIRKAFEHIYIDGSNSDGKSKVEFSEYLTARRYSQIRNPLGKEDSTIIHVIWSIADRLCLSVGRHQKELDQARKDAKEALEKYMEAKHHSDRADKTYILKCKQDWINASNNVKNCKYDLCNAHLAYTRFNQWYKATNDYIEFLEKINDELDKNKLVFHKVHCLDKPDENGYITYDNPGEVGKEYLIRLKRGGYVIQELTEAYDEGLILEDYAWEDVDAWAELPEDAIEVN